MLEDIEADDETLTFEVEDLELSVDFEGMELLEVCTLEEDPSWPQWECGVCTPTMEAIWLQETDSQ